MEPVKTGEFLEHLTRSGERWDILAYQYYNDADLSGLIIDANADLFLENLSPIPAVLSPGTTLLIPVIEQKSVSDTLLPPWKRAQGGDGR